MEANTACWLCFVPVGGDLCPLAAIFAWSNSHHRGSVHGRRVVPVGGEWCPLEADRARWWLVAPLGGDYCLSVAKCPLLVDVAL